MIDKNIQFITDQEIIAIITNIKRTNPKNLAAKHFNSDYFLSLNSDKKKGMKKIISTCIKNPDSSVGAYAMFGTDYDDFRNFFEPIIREYHNIEIDEKIEQKHDWSNSSICDLGLIDRKLKDVSMRVRVARNLKEFALPGAMDRQDRVEMENTMIDIFKILIDNPNYGGRYLSLTPDSYYKISDDEFNNRVDEHQMFKDMSLDRHLNAANISADWPYGRGMYISSHEDFIVWVGEEDHLRVMSMKTGGNLTELFERLEHGLKQIEDKLNGFAESSDFGYITSCPTNLGGGMRASLHMKLPNLSKKGTDLTKIKSIAKDCALSVRGAGGEHSDAGEDGLVDISPSARLGVTEKEVMQMLYDGANILWKQENDPEL